MNNQKKIIFLRHGNSPTNFESDIKRELDSKGRRDIKAISTKLIKESSFRPEKTLCSSALRAKQSCKTFLDCTEISEEFVSYFEEFYNEGEKAIRKEIAKLNKNITTCMIIGHNPTLEDIIYNLSKKTIGLGTSNVVCLISEEKDLSWEESMTSSWKIIHHFCP